MEVDEVCETVKQQQQQISQSEDATVSGELKPPVPEAISKTEVLALASIVLFIACFCSS